MTRTGSSGGRLQKFTRSGRWWGWLSLALLLPGLVLCAFFVTQPEPAIASGAALVTDVALRFVSLVVAVSTLALVAGRHSLAIQAGAVASVGCLLVGVAVLLAGVWSPFRDLRVLFLAVGAISTAAIDLYRHQHAWRHLGSPKRTVAAVLALAAVPVFSFWTQTSFLPSQNRASLTAGVAVEFVEAPDGSGHAVVETTLTNTSDVRALVVITNLTVCHWAGEQDRTDLLEEPPEQSPCERLPPPFGELSWVDPGAELTHRTSLERRSGSPLLEVLFRINYARADRMVEVVEPEPEVTPEQQGTCAAATLVNLQALSRLESLARHGLALMYADIDGDGGRTYLIGSGPGLVCRRAPDLVERTSGLNQHFGLTESTPQWVGWPPAGETP